MAVQTKIQQVHVARLKAGGDLLTEIHEFCQNNGIQFGMVSIIGALKNATLGAYDFEQNAYSTFTIDHTIEILHCTGNISMLDGKPFAHLHATVSGHDGKALGGHVFEGCEIAVAECIIQQFEGPALLREEDPVTGLKLWKAES